GIADRLRVDGGDLYRQATDVIFSNGYVRGEAPESAFWEQLGQTADIELDLSAHREIILAAFKPLRGMPELVARIRERIPVGLLTDQCNWLYELDDRDGLLGAFDTVVNSYEEGYTKRDMEIFRIACQRFGLLPEEIAFFDDNQSNIDRAVDFGMKAFLFEGPENTERILAVEGVEIPPVLDKSSRFQVPGSTEEEPEI
ncbi:MAG: HAD-IA family hydrolase, partial [Pseudomonadota bacterium]